MDYYSADKIIGRVYVGIIAILMAVGFVYMAMGDSNNGNKSPHKETTATQQQSSETKEPANSYNNELINSGNYYYSPVSPQSFSPSDAYDEGYDEGYEQGLQAGANGHYYGYCPKVQSNGS